MAELKTQKNDGDVLAYLNSVEPERKRNDSLAILEMMQEITGDAGQMWGSSIVGFGDNSYTTADGKEHTWFQVGFAPRKQSLTLYIMDGFDNYDELLGKLGKHKTGKACLYVNKLADIDEDVLRELVTQSVAHVKATQA